MSSQPPYPQDPQSGQWPEQQPQGGYPPAYPPPPAYPSQPMYGPPGMPPMPGMVAMPDQRRGMAMAGLILGVCTLGAMVLGVALSVVKLTSWLPGLLFFASLPLAIVGIVLSALGRKSTTRSGLALTGLILSIIGLILWILLIALIIVGVALLLNGGVTT